MPEVSLSTLLQKCHKYGYNRALEIRVPNHIGFCRPLLISSRIGSTFPFPSVSVGPETLATLVHVGVLTECALRVNPDLKDTRKECGLLQVTCR